MILKTRAMAQTQSSQELRGLKSMSLAARLRARRHRRDAHLRVEKSKKRVG
jgi:hypothetical protein